MGALHQGHIALVKESAKKNDITVASIFVNPTQFNSQEDLLKYPRTIEKDIALLGEAGCDVLFHPEPLEMYPGGFETQHYDWGNITNSLEGAFRPGHFDGVITIVHRLLEIVKPTSAYFGQKDFQQCAVINEMVKRFGLNVKIEICPTLREQDGLAMSSRNIRLNDAERKDALLIYEALSYMRRHVTDAPDKLITGATDIILKGPHMKPEYIAVVDAVTLNPVINQADSGKYVALIATWCGNVRLIDNMVLTD